MQKLGFVVKSKNSKPETVHAQMQSQMERRPISPSLGWRLVQRPVVSISAHRPGIRGVAAVTLQWRDHWVSVRQGQALDQKRERESPLEASKARLSGLDVTWKLWTFASGTASWAESRFPNLTLEDGEEE